MALGEEDVPRRELDLAQATGYRLYRVGKNPLHTTPSSRVIADADTVCRRESPARHYPPNRRINRSAVSRFGTRVAVVLLRRYARTHSERLTEVARRLIGDPEARESILAGVR